MAASTFSAIPRNSSRFIVLLLNLAVVCTASWNDRKRYGYNGSWRMALNDDGTVEAIFAGPGPDVESMVDACRRGPSQARVTSIDITPTPDPPPGAFARRPTA
jgi:hypothetical protein